MIKSKSVIVSRMIPVVLVLILGVFGFLGITGKVSFTVPPTYASVPSQVVLIIHDSSDEGGRKVHSQIVAALGYAKVTFESLDLSETTVLPALKRYSSLATATEFINKLDETESRKIEEFVYDGGGLAVLYRTWNPHLRELFGISNLAAPEFIETRGIEFRRDYQPGIRDQELGDQEYLTLSSEDAPLIVSLDLVPARGVQLVAVSGSGRPLIWENRYGNGRVLYYNVDWLAFKMTRGLIVQSILSTQQVGAMAIANIGVFQVDDFPSPPSTARLEPINTEYGLSVSDFYQQVWYPDIVSLGRKFDIEYTFFTIFNYNGLVEPPFGFEEWEHARVRLNDQDMPFTIYAAHQIAQQYELGLHGYNHDSLTLEGWLKSENILEALLVAGERWAEDGLGESPFSYVPPHNIYDEAGIKALTEAFPSIKVVSGQYLEVFEEGGFREFGPDPWAEQIFDMPRMTYGYFLTAENRLMMLGGLNMFGVFTHFIHPDDVLHNPENYPPGELPPGTEDLGGYRNLDSLPWRGDYDGGQDGFYYQLESILDFNQRNFPWLRYLSTQQAYYEFQRYFDIDVSFSFKPYQMTVTLSDSPAYFQVRVNDGRRIDLSELKNCQFISVYEGDGYDIYTFKALGKEVLLKFIMPVK